MNCEKAEKLILSEGSAEGLPEHIASCADCRSMADAWTTLKDVQSETPAPSSVLDVKIRGAAAARLAQQKQHRNTLIMRFAVFAAAACFVMVTWFSLDNLSAASKMEQPGRPWANIDMGNDFYALMSELDLGIKSISYELLPDFGDEPDELDIIVRAGEPLEG